MSYTFTVTAHTKAEAKRQIAARFGEVVNGQPTHEADRYAAVACAQAFIDALADPNEIQEVYINMFGSLGWEYDPSAVGEPKFNAANLSISAYLQPRS